MIFVIVGVLVILLHLGGFGPMADWNWKLTGDLWKFCFPFGCAAVWWAWADGTGYTKRKEIEKMEERKIARRDKNLVALGIDPRQHHKKSARAAAYVAKRASEGDRIEKGREAERKKARDSVINSRIDGGPDTRR